MFGKTMSIPDSAIYKYFLLATKVNDLDLIKKTLDDGKENPRNLKVRLAKEIISQFYDLASADAALARFEQLFVKKEAPDDIEELLLPIGSECVVVDLMVEMKMAASKGEARRLIQGGGVTLNGEKVSHDKATLIPTSDGIILKVGKRRFLKVKSA
jgi:tyrosyl-tRNA synthetase